MKKHIYLLATCLFLGIAAAQAAQIGIVPQSQFTNQTLGRNAVLKIENNDQKTYYVTADPIKSTLSLSPLGQGSSLVPARSTAYVLFEAGGTWSVVGNGKEHLDVTVAPGQTTTIMLEAVGEPGKTGLLAIEGQLPNRKSAMLFAAADNQQPIPIPQPQTTMRETWATTQPQTPSQPNIEIRQTQVTPQPQPATPQPNVTMPQPQVVVQPPQVVVQPEVIVGGGGYSAYPAPAYPSYSAYPPYEYRTGSSLGGILGNVAGGVVGGLLGSRRHTDYYYAPPPTTYNSYSISTLPAPAAAPVPSSSDTYNTYNTYNQSPAPTTSGAPDVSSSYDSYSESAPPTFEAPDVSSFSDSNYDADGE